MTDFTEFPKISRLFRDIVITEKIDGTNAQICIDRVPQGGPYDHDSALYMTTMLLSDPDMGPLETLETITLRLRCGSRTRWITPKDDNFGFASWVWENGRDLFQLGEGQHFGEWWGKGIQRGYGLQERRFSLFNTSRWNDDAVRPSCCHVVPTLYEGLFNTEMIRLEAEVLWHRGSVAAPGFMKPEGIVVFHKHSNSLFKYTLKNDEAKGKQP